MPYMTYCANMRSFRKCLTADEAVGIRDDVRRVLNAIYTCSAVRVKDFRKTRNTVWSYSW
jgi:hypothetical protein